MSDQCEEQEMEQEALAAIFDEDLEVVSAEQPFKWAVSIWPEQHSPDENHVGIKLISSVPLEYPETSLPEFEIELLKGLTAEHKDELLVMAKEEAEANMGMPAIFAVCERLREWLIDNNVKGMDDVSMYAQMIRREKEAEKQAEKEKLKYESQKEVEEMTEAESEQLAVQKRRAEGTNCNKENFEAWAAKFAAEMAQQAEEESRSALTESGNRKKNKTEKVVDKSGRISGFLQFSGKVDSLNMEAIEAACDNAEADEDDEEMDVEDENLFDVDDDDLDDLDFDDDEEDDEEPDI